MEPASFADWRITSLGVFVLRRVCQSWLTRDWASSGALLVSDAAERAFGDKLRLDEYKESFVHEAHYISFLIVLLIVCTYYVRILIMD